MNSSHDRIRYVVTAQGNHPIHETIASHVRALPILKNLNFGGVYLFDGAADQVAHVKRFFQELSVRFPNVISQ